MTKKIIDLFFMGSFVVFIFSFVLMIGALTSNAKEIYVWITVISVTTFMLAGGLDSLYSHGYKKGLNDSGGENTEKLELEQD